MSSSFIAADVSSLISRSMAFILHNYTQAEHSYSPIFHLQVGWFKNFEALKIHRTINKPKWSMLSCARPDNSSKAARVM